MNPTQLEDQQALAIVAHYDDAVLWMGGTILRTTKILGWHWTVVAMCVPNRERRDHFERSCGALHADPVSMDFQHYQGDPAFEKNKRQEMEAQLTRKIDGQSIQWVLTHSRDPHCEYGYHANHVAVREVVKAVVAHRKTRAGNSTRVAYFSYSAIYACAGLPTVAKRDARFFLPMKYRELGQKCHWCAKAADADSSLENIGFPCPNPEAFEGDHLDLPCPFVAKDEK